MCCVCSIIYSTSSTSIRDKVGCIFRTKFICDLHFVENVKKNLDECQEQYYMIEENSDTLIWKNDMINLEQLVKNLTFNS